MKNKSLFFLISILTITILAFVFIYEPLFQKISSFRAWKLGLDLAGGSYLIYKIDLTNVTDIDRQETIKGLRDVIEKRINLFGVNEPRVYLEKVGEENRLIVELAGIKDVNQAIKEIGETPFLEFREYQEVEINGTTSPVFIPTQLNGRYLKRAVLGFDSITNQPVVNLEFNDQGAKLFEEITARNINKPLAVFLDNELIEAPIVKEKISGGKAQISGNFTVESARKLVQRFNAGALPVPIELINQYSVSAELGENSLREAILAGIVGTLLIIIFMIIYYKKLGIFSALALIIYVILTLAIFKILPITLTLAGLAGFILSIGMAIDANILVFERTKEELKKGLSRVNAVEEGFKRAWSSIRDSNISTLITSFILYNFTSSFVRGFALTLFIGVLVSMFSAITVTRNFLRIFLK